MPPSASPIRQWRGLNQLVDMAASNYKRAFDHLPENLLALFFALRLGKQMNPIAEDRTQ